jgi:hypothetical protein
VGTLSLIWWRGGPNEPGPLYEVLVGAADAADRLTATVALNETRYMRPYRYDHPDWLVK